MYGPDFVAAKVGVDEQIGRKISCPRPERPSTKALQRVVFWKNVLLDHHFAFCSCLPSSRFEAAAAAAADDVGLSARMSSQLGTPKERLRVQQQQHFGVDIATSEPLRALRREKGSPPAGRPDPLNPGAPARCLSAFRSLKIRPGPSSAADAVRRWAQFGEWTWIQTKPVVITQSAEPDPLPAANQTEH